MLVLIFSSMVHIFNLFFLHTHEYVYVHKKLLNFLSSYVFQRLNIYLHMCRLHNPHKTYINKICSYMNFRKMNKHYMSISFFILEIFKFEKIAWFVCYMFSQYLVFCIDPLPYVYSYAYVYKENLLLEIQIIWGCQIKDRPNQCTFAKERRLRFATIF